MVDECNRILKLLKKDRPKFKYSDRISKRKSIEMFKLWRDYHHKGSSEEVVARNWNGGTYGYKNVKLRNIGKKYYMNYNDPFEKNADMLKDLLYIYESDDILNKDELIIPLIENLIEMNEFLSFSLIEDQIRKIIEDE